MRPTCSHTHEGPVGLKIKAEGGIIKNVKFKIKKRRSLDWTLWKKEPPKLQLSLFTAGHLLVGVQPTLNHNLFPQWEKAQPLKPRLITKSLRYFFDNFGGKNWELYLKHTHKHRTTLEHLPPYSVTRLTHNWKWSLICYLLVSAGTKPWSLLQASSGLLKNRGYRTCPEALRFHEQIESRIHKSTVWLHAFIYCLF